MYILRLLKIVGKNTDACKRDQQNMLNEYESDPFFLK